MQDVYTKIAATAAAVLSGVTLFIAWSCCKKTNELHDAAFGKKKP